MGIIIQKLDNSQRQKIIDLILPIQQDEFGVPLTLADQPDLADIKYHYIQGGGNFWGAFVDNELCGTIALLKFDDRRAALRKMFVKKEFRGKNLGIAHALLRVLVHYSKDAGIQKIYLGTVNILGAAIKFYLKNGFVPLRKDQLPEGFPIMHSDNLFYELNLEQELSSAGEK